MLAEFTVLEQVSSCGSVSCLINTEPLELLHLQPSEPIASESAAYLYKCPPFSCPIQYSLSQFPCSAIDWYICSGTFNFPFPDGFMLLWPDDQLSGNPLEQITWCRYYFMYLSLRVQIFFYLRHNFCGKTWTLLKHWIDGQLILRRSKTGYNLLTWTITFMFPVTII